MDIANSKTIRNGLSLNNKTGIFESNGNPAISDAGVPKSSIALDYSTPALYFKFGVNTTDWKRLDNIQSGSGFSTLVAIFSEEYPPGEPGGYSKDKEWHERSINTIDSIDPNITRVGDDMSLPSGSYIIRVKTFGSEQKAQKLRLTNETDSVIIKTGSSTTEGNPELVAMVTLNKTSLIAIDHYVNISDEHKEEDDLFILGKPVDDGSNEIYLTCEVWRQ